VNVFESVRIALRGLSSNKLRSFLTMLGIIIGVAAVIALLSVGQGVQASITAQIQSTGSNLITITPGGQRSSNASVATQGGQQATLTSQDAQAIIDAGLPDVVAVSPEFGTGGQIQFGSQTSFGQITGVTPDYLAVHNMNVANGEFISKAANDSVSQVVVLGAAVANALFNDMDPVGQSVKLNRANYRVIGVLESKGGASFGSPDNGAFVPLTSAQRRLIGGGRGFGVGQRVSTIGVSAASEAQVDSAIAAITDILRTQHKIQVQQDDFTIISQKQILSVFDQVTGILTAFLGAIAGISLLVGGIGIMNIMLVSVSERTREIGIRKAVGAKRRDIMTQFLVEATVLSLLGGAGGIALGWAISESINRLKIGTNGSATLTTLISPNSILLAVGFSVAVGLFFGIYPATRAAALRPIDALRYE
jgi:putative ABC transport system permease protein